MGRQTLAQQGMRPPGRTMIRRLLRAADFERVLGTRTRGSTLHFALHHVADHPRLPAPPRRTVARMASTANPAPPRESRVAAADLSTDASCSLARPVDDSPVLTDIWLGAVVPKRHARRCVTRTLIKRQIRAVMAGHVEALAGGLWVIRLRCPFDRATFTSAASHALKSAAREELEQLLGGAARRARRA